MMDQTSQYREETDFRDLLRKPEKLFGFSYVYCLIVLTAIGLLYFSNLTTIGKNSVAPVVPADSSTMISDIPFQSPRVIPPVDVMKAGVASEGLIANGRELFKANCVSCHGDNGQGDGPSGLLMNPKPRNFHVLEGWTNGPKVFEIFKTLQEGIVKNGMASFSYLSPLDRFSLIHYVRSFYGQFPQDTPEELKQLDATYGLSKGMNVPGQVPVKKAMQIILKESEDNVNAVWGEAKAAMESDATGALILRRVASDERRVLTSFRKDGKLFPTLYDFVKEVSADPVHLGFKARVVQLSHEEWVTMYDYIDKMKK